MMKMISSDSDFNITEKEKIFKKKCMEARAKAVSHIGIGTKPSLKVSGWLSEKGYPSFIVKRVIEELKEDGYIDDIKCAKKIIRTRNDKKSESAMALKQRLIISGIPEETAQKCINEAFTDPEKELNDAENLLNLKFGREIGKIHELKYNERQKFILRCKRFLSGRGYSGEIIIKALKIFMKDEIYYE